MWETLEILLVGGGVGVPSVLYCWHRTRFAHALIGNNISIKSQKDVATSVHKQFEIKLTIRLKPGKFWVFGQWFAAMQMQENWRKFEKTFSQFYWVQIWLKPCIFDLYQHNLLVHTCVFSCNICLLTFQCPFQCVWSQGVPRDITIVLRSEPLLQPLFLLSRLGG